MTDQDARDSTVAAAFVRPPAPHNATIELVEYDSAWPALFEREANRIRTALGQQVVRLEHVGSTSIPGMAAKARIDMVLAVPDSSAEASYLPRLEAAGYPLTIREPEWHEHRVFKGVDMDINLHVFTAGNAEIDRMVGFRDWLRSHPEDHALYLSRKRELAGRTWRWVQDYADAKSEVVADITARAGLSPQER
ncbi:MAG: GrpB family protein [Candidatus Limnocylindrales bacterium]